MKRLLLDTNALIWLALDVPRLGSAARSSADAARREGRLAVSAISFWEVAMLVARGRISLDLPPDRWRRTILSAGVEEFPITGSIGMNAAAIADFHADPADRFIVATALEHDAVLMTSDRKILAWSGPLISQDACD